MNYLRSRLVVWLALGAGIALTFLTGFFLGRSQPAMSKQASSNDPHESVVDARSRIAEVFPTESRSGGRAESTRDQNHPAQFENKLQAALATGSDLQRELEVCKLAMTLGPADMPQAFERAQRLTTPDKWMVTQRLTQRWAEIDPRGAIEFARNMPGGSGGALRYGVLGTWAASDPARAIAFVNGLSPGFERRQMIGELVSAMAPRDPERAFELLKAVPTKRFDGRYANLFMHWIMRDPAVATAAALALPRGDDRNGAIEGIAAGWAATDPKAALAWATQMAEAEGTKREAVNTIVRKWAESDPAAAVEAVAAISDSARGDGLTLALSLLASRNPQRAIAFCDELPAGATRIKALRTLVYGLADSAPKTASDLALKMPPGDERNSSMGYAMSRWASRDPQAALDFSKSLPTGSERGIAVQQIASAWTKIDPHAAAEFFASNSGEPGSSEALKSVVSSWTSAFPDEALAWLEKLGDTKQKEALLPIPLAAIARSDPERAIRSASVISSSDPRARAVSGVIASWSSNDPAAAAQWASTQRDGTIATDAFSQVADKWARRDPVAAAAWLEKLPAGAGRDAAAAGFAGAVQRADPETALAWVSTLSDATKRQTQLENIASDWLRNDTDAAKRWLTSTAALPAEIKARLLKNLP